VAATEQRRQSAQSAHLCQAAKKSRQWVSLSTRLIRKGGLWSFEEVVFDHPWNTDPLSKAKIRFAKR
jgi:hypothetical protein